MPTRQRITPHFRVEEFDCHDGRRVPPAAQRALELLGNTFLERMRERFGPVTVLSGYRHQRYNQGVGGAADSRHIYDKVSSPASAALIVERGVAADIRCARGRVEDWADYAATIRERSPYLKGRSKGGIGEYNAAGFVHLDTGPRRDWNG